MNSLPQNALSQRSRLLRYLSVSAVIFADEMGRFGGAFLFLLSEVSETIPALLREVFSGSRVRRSLNLSDRV